VTVEEQNLVKLIMSWDITPEHEQDYFEFVIRDYIPGVQRMGCELTDAWATVYGNKPQITVSVIIGSPCKARQLLFSEDWLSLNNRLQDFIQNYTMKLVYARNRFQL